MIAVVLFHAGMISGGYLGVDIFFIISGYLITSIIINDLQNSKFSFLDFYLRRARRILPMLLFITAVCIPFAWLLMNSRQLLQFAYSAVAVEFFASNFWFAHSIDYFSPATKLMPLLHTWSLGVEEQYYLLWPLILQTVWRYAHKYVLIILFITSMGSLILAQYLSTTNTNLNFYLLPSRVWELMLGAILALQEFKHGRSKNTYLRQIMPMLGLLTILSCMLLFKHGNLNPNFWTCIPAIATLFIIWYGGTNDFATKLLSLKVCVGVGLISYSIYLWHQPILAFINLSTYKISYLQYILFFLMTFGLACASWKYIEVPFRNRSLILTKLFLQIFAIVFMLVLAFAVLTILNRGFPEKSIVPYKVLDTITISADPMHLQGIGDLTKSNIDFVVYGDSHVQATVVPIMQAATDCGVRGVMSEVHGCLPVFKLNSSKAKSKCTKMHTEVLELIKSKNIKHAILIGRWQYVLRDDPNEFLRDFANTLAIYKQLGVQVSLLLQSPEQNGDPSQLYTLIYRSPPLMREDKLVQLSLPTYKHSERQEAFLNFIHDYREALTFYDPSSYLCNAAICPLGTLETSYYADISHLSIDGSILLLPLFKQMFSNLSAAE